MEAHLCTQRQPERPRFAQECAVELRRASDKPGLDGTGGPRSLQRRIKADLDVSLVEQVLAPELDCPGVVGTVHADAAVEQGEGLLGLLDVEVRAGIELAHVAAVEIDKAAKSAA